MKPSLRTALFTFCGLTAASPAFADGGVKMARGQTAQTIRYAYEVQAQRTTLAMRAQVFPLKKGQLGFLAEGLVGEKHGAEYGGAVWGVLDRASGAISLAGPSKAERLRARYQAAGGTLESADKVRDQLALELRR